MDSLREFLCSIQLIFDVTVLREVWAANLEFYSNNLTGYNFFYELPHKGIVGGEGVYVRSIISQGMGLEVVEEIRHHMFGMTSNLFFISIQSHLYLLICFLFHTDGLCEKERKWREHWT